MSQSRLKIISETSLRNEPSKKRDYKREAEAHFNHLWETEPQQFCPFRNCMEALRIKRTAELFQERDLNGKKTADLGCGYAVLAKKMAEKGASVDAVDIADIPLQRLEKKNSAIHPLKEYVPHTRLADQDYDLVLCTELIGDLPKEEYRLFFSELCRLIKPEGRVICSTLLDVYTEGAIQQFASLAETEFTIEKWVLSYHYLWTLLLNFFKAPERFVKAAKDPVYRAQEIGKRRSIYRFWFKLNSAFLPSLFWRVGKWAFYPFTLLLKKSTTLLLMLESISRFFWQEEGISHAIFLAKRRPLFEPPPPDQQPIERRTKKIVWE